MIYLVGVLLAATAASLGLRLTWGLLPAIAHPVGRLMMAMVVGASIVGLTLVASSRYRMLEAGLGLLISLAPVGIYDLLRWWFRFRRDVNQP